MKIDLSSIKTEAGLSKTFEFCEEYPPLIANDEEYPFTEPVCIKGKVTNTGEGYLVDAKAQGSIKIECSRCLEPYTHDISVEFSELYTADKDDAEKQTGERELKERDFRNLLVEEDILDLTDDLRQNFLLNFPMKPLCNESCRGLCSQCGQNLNDTSCSCKDDIIDERFAILKKLFDNDDSKE